MNGQFNHTAFKNYVRSYDYFLREYQTYMDKVIEDMDARPRGRWAGAQKAEVDFVIDIRLFKLGLTDQDTINHMMGLKNGKRQVAEHIRGCLNKARRIAARPESFNPPSANNDTLPTGFLNHRRFVA